MKRALKNQGSLALLVMGRTQLSSPKPQKIGIFPSLEIIVTRFVTR
jgi:hypothetical protein